MIHNLHKLEMGGNVVLKVDIAKAYNSIDWDFLMPVLSSFSFSLEICDLVRQCVTALWYFVAMNGTVNGLFNDGRGPRQGDTLSPYLFIIVEDILFGMLQTKFEGDRISSFSLPNEAPLISHLLYANDTLIIANGGKYEEWSGQAVSVCKTSIFPNQITVVRRRMLLRLISFT